MWMGSAVVMLNGDLGENPPPRGGSFVGWWVLEKSLCSSACRCPKRAKGWECAVMYGTPKGSVGQHTP